MHGHTNVKMKLVCMAYETTAPVLILTTSEIFLYPVVTMLPALKKIFGDHKFEGYCQVETRARHG
jgi:hypothetical protein